MADTYRMPRHEENERIRALRRCAFLLKRIVEGDHRSLEYAPDALAEAAACEEAAGESGLFEAEEVITAAAG